MLSSTLFSIVVNGSTLKDLRRRQITIVKMVFRGGSRIFFRRGCTRLLLYFNTNKPHIFWGGENTSCIRKPQVISGGGVRTPCTLPLDPPLVLYEKHLGKVRFFLGGGGLGPQRGGSSVKVSTKGGGPYPLFQLFKGRVTHLFQNFCDVIFHFSLTD